MRIRVLSIALGCLLAACGSLPPERQATPDLVELRDGRLGWAGLYLGESQAQAEHSAAKTLPIAPQANPACGQFGTETPLYGRKLVLQWSGEGPAATLDTLSVALPAEEGPPEAAALAARIHDRLPELQALPATEGSALLRGPDGQVVLIKTGKEHFLLLSPASCLD